MIPDFTSPDGIVVSRDYENGGRTATVLIRVRDLDFSQMEKSGSQWRVHYAFKTPGKTGTVIGGGYITVHSAELMKMAAERVVTQVNQEIILCALAADSAYHARKTPTPPEVRLFLTGRTALVSYLVATRPAGYSASQGGSALPYGPGAVVTQANPGGGLRTVSFAHVQHFIDSGWVHPNQAIQLATLMAVSASSGKEFAPTYAESVAAEYALSDPDTWPTRGAFPTGPVGLGVPDPPEGRTPLRGALSGLVAHDGPATPAGEDGMVDPVFGRVVDYSEDGGWVLFEKGGKQAEISIHLFGEILRALSRTGIDSPEGLLDEARRFLKLPRPPAPPTTARGWLDGLVDRIRVKADMAARAVRERGGTPEEIDAARLTVIGEHMTATTKALMDLDKGGGE